MFLQAKLIEFNAIRATDVQLPEGAVFVIANEGRDVSIHPILDGGGLSRADYSFRGHGMKIELHDVAAADRDLARLMGLEPKEQEALSPEDAANLIAAAMERMDELDGLEPPST